MRFFRKNPWSIQAVAPSWGNLLSIYDRVREDPSAVLPDEGKVFPRGRLKWVSGAMDGVLNSHVERGETKKRVLDIADALRQLERRADEGSLQRLYDLVVQDSLVGLIDAVLDHLEAQSVVHDKPRLREIGRYLATRADHREAVKFGMALIGVCGKGEDAEILQVLGRNDEFTLFAAVGLPRTAKNGEQALWELARQVHGWGRIQIVRRLGDTEDSEIQAWMLRDGFRNTVMDEYLACICARAGRLHEALNQQIIDDALVDGAADIIRALICGGPADDIDDYEFAPDVCESYTNIVLFRPEATLKHFLTITALRQFLNEPSEWEKRYKSNWTESRRQTLTSIVNEVFGRNEWRNMVEAALISNDAERFDEGDRAAQSLGVDTWTLHFERVKAAPLTSSSWYRLMEQTDESRIDAVLAFGERILPFEEIETGPADELGMGPKFQAHGVLDWILQDLRRFPHRGWRFIRAGLRSPVVRNRNMAINALGAWPRESWSDETRAFIIEACDSEPEQDVRQRLTCLLDGTALTQDEMP